MAYGYVRDDAPTQVDWNKVGNDMTKILEDEVTDRENRKASIDKIDADFALSLLDQPQGANAETNRFMADLSKDAGSQMAKDIDDLRNGRLSERDYYKKRANTTQGVDIMFKAGKSFNANFDKAMKRANDGTSSSREIFLREQMEGFLKFSKSGAYINPLTGEINVAERTKNDDGTFSLSTTPGSFANASELLRLSTQEYDKFDVQGNITDVIENLGTIMVKDKMGVTTEMAFNNLYDDKKSVALMNDAKVNLIESILANDNQKSSILSDRMGYDFTYDEEKAKKDSKLLLMLPDGSIKFTEAQDKEATAYVESLFEAGLDKKITERQNLTAKETASISIQNKRFETKGGKEDPPDFQDIKDAVNKEIDALDFSEVKDFTKEEDVIKLKEILSPYVAIRETEPGNDVITLTLPGKEDIDIDLEFFLKVGDEGETEQTIKERIKDYITPTSDGDELDAYFLKFGNRGRKLDDAGIPIIE